MCAGLPQAPHGMLLEHKLLFRSQLLSIYQCYVSLVVTGLLACLCGKRCSMLSV